MLYATVPIVEKLEIDTIKNSANFIAGMAAVVPRRECGGLHSEQSFFWAQSFVYYVWDLKMDGAKVLLTYDAYKADILN